MSSETDDPEAADLPEPPPSAVPQQRPGKKGGRRDVNRRERTRALLDAATELFLERGIEGTTIDEITKAAGVSKGSFYRYFASKAQLVETLYVPLREVIEQAFTASGERLRQAGSPDEMNAAFVELGENLGVPIFENLELVQLYLQECRGPHTDARAPVRELATAIIEGAVELTDKAHEQGLMRDFPARVSALTVVGAAERLLFAVLVEESIDEPLEVPAQLTSLVMDGLWAQRS
jgi:AcrR family transcriptional regulator